MISPSDIENVQKYWFSISTLSNANQICPHFYKELFRRYPEYRVLFTLKVELQAEKLSKMLNIIVNGVSIWEQLESEIVKLGYSHANLGDFTKQDYDNVFETLYFVMEGFREKEDKDAYVSWRNIFSLISKTMMDASEYNRKSD